MMSSLLRKVALAGSIILAMMVAGLARGESGDHAPIEAHSLTSVTVRRGDRVTLEVKLSTANEVKVSWASGDLVLCDKPSCLLETELYSIGRHPLVLTVAFRSEVFLISYEIDIEPMPIGERPRNVFVPLVAPRGDLLHVSPLSFVAKPLKGRGFKEDTRGLEAMPPDFRPLSWNERLKTHPEGSLIFGLPAKEHHTLGESTEVWLSWATLGKRPEAVSGVAEAREKSQEYEESPERLIILTEGTLRSRQLAHSEPQWTILLPRQQKDSGVGEGSEQSFEAQPIYLTWLQVKADPKGDVIIVRQKPQSKGTSRHLAFGTAKGEKVSIFVVRGSAQVTRTLCDGNIEDCLVKNTTQALEIPAGSSLTIEADGDEVWGEGEAPWLSTADSGVFSQAFAEVSPQYGPGENPARYGPSWTLLGHGGAKTKELALSRAQKALLEEDWLLALEETYPFLGVLGDRATLILGLAYTGLGIPSHAKKYLAMAMAFQGQSPEPPLLLAHLSLRDMRWKEAAKHLASYDRLGGVDSPWISYYQGVVADRLGERRFARREMLSSIREAQQESTRKAAQLFVDKVDRDASLKASAMAGVFYDSRVLRSRVDQNLLPGPDALRIDKVSGIQFQTALELRGYEDSEALLKLEGLFEGKAYSDGRLRALNPFHPEIALRFAFQPGANHTRESWIRTEMRPFLGTRVLGHVRALDDYGADFKVNSPRLRDLSFGLRSLMSKDPNPNYDDLFEPHLREIVPKDDQSHHDVRYLAGLSLVRDFASKIECQIALGDYRYDGSRRKFESFVYHEAGFKGDYKIFPHHLLLWDLTFLSRSFSMSEDKRRDQDVNLSLRWSLSHTPLLSHVFGVGFEKQRSTRASQDFSRESAEYQMRFDF